MFMGQLNCLLNHLSKGRLSDHTCLHLNYSPRLTSEANKLFPGTAKDLHRSPEDRSSPENASLSPLTQKGVEGECLRNGCLPWGHLYPPLLHLPGSSPLPWLQEQPSPYSLLWTLHVARTCWISPKGLCKTAVMCIFIWIIYINYIIVTHAPHPTCTLVMHRTQRLSAFTVNHAIRLHPSGKLSLKWPFSYILIASTTILFN